MNGPSRFFLGLVGALATVELVSAAFAYRTRVEPAHWEEAREVLAVHPAEEPIVMATAWLEPRARMAIPTVASQASDARPDLWGHARIHTLGLASRRGAPSWLAEIDPASTPRRSQQLRVGPLVLETWTLTPARERLAMLHGRGTALEILADGTVCPRRGSRWQCPAVTVEDRLLEVAGVPRRCMAVTAATGVTVELRDSAFPTGDLLRGHIGFGDFNGVLRSDAPVELEVRVDDTVRLRTIATDEEGWKAVQIPTEPGRRALTVRLTIADSASATPRPPCLELRSFGSP